MTISNENCKVTVIGNDAQMIFNYGFLIPQNVQPTLLMLGLDGTITPVNNAQWSFTGAGNPNGGTFTYPLSGSPIATGVTLTLLRDVPYSQVTNLVNQKALYPESVEGALDWLAEQTQQLAEVQGRALTVPAVDDAISPLPSVADRAGRVLGFNGNGQPVMFPEGTSPVPGISNYDVVAFLPGRPNASQRLVQALFARPVSFSAGFAGSRASCLTAPTANFMLDIQYNGATIGTVTFLAGQTTGAFTAGSEFTTAAGGSLSLVAQPTQDATIADISVAFAGTSPQVNGSSEGATVFIELLDVPSSYTGAAGQAVAVNGSASGLEFVPFPTGGPEAFTDLTDVPHSYTGQAGKVAKVNPGETALIFATETGGVTEFIQLSDAPNSYVGFAGQVPTVNPGETALVFAPAGATYSAGAGLGLTGTVFSITDPELTALMALTSAANQLAYYTGSGTAALTTLTAAGRALIDDADAAAQRVTLGLGTMAVQNATAVAITGGSVVGITDLLVADGGTGSSTASGARTNLGVVPGTDVQTQNANLQTIAGLISAADTAPYFTGSGTAALMTVTSFARTLLDDTSQAGMQSTLGLGTMATQAATAVAITGGTITGITDLAIADGGTGASTAANARTNLGLAIGTDVQAFDTDLTAIAALVSAADNLPYATGVGTWAMTSFTSVARTLVGNTSAATMRNTLGVAIGSQVQAFDADLQAIAALVSAADQLPYATGTSTWAMTTMTATARTLLDDTSISAMRTTLGLAIGTNVEAWDADLDAIAALTSAADQAPYATGTSTWAMMTVTAAARTVLDDTTVALMLATLGGMPLAGGNFTGLVTQSGANGIIVGSTSSFATVFATAALTSLVQIQSASTASLMIARFGASASPPIMSFSKSRGTTVGTQGAVTAADQLGAFSFAGSDGTAMRDGPRIVASVTATPTTTGVPSRLDIIVNDGTSAITSLGMDSSGNATMAGSSNIVIGVNRHLRLRSYTVATLPSAATATEMIYVSDGAGGLREAVSDGTTWRLSNGQDAAQTAFNSQTGTTYTLVLADIYRRVEMNNASANTLTVPPNSSVAFAIGAEIEVVQMGAGQTTIAAGAGVTIRSASGNLKITGQYAGAVLSKRATDEWVLIGSLAP